MAAGIRRQSYSPYSKFAVGVALLAKSGEIYCGVNVENASYGLTICAERSALSAAVTCGDREFHAIAISLKDGGSPCGACRQVLYEFSPEMRVLMADEEGSLIREMSLNELLPDGFGPSSL